MHLKTVVWIEAALIFFHFRGVLIEGFHYRGSYMYMYLSSDRHLTYMYAFSVGVCECSCIIISLFISFTL